MAKDAVNITPKFVPLVSLLPRDDSGGPDFEPHSGDFGEGGMVTGPKGHLSAGSGPEDSKTDDRVKLMKQAKKYGG